MELIEIFKQAVQKGASDIHLVIGKPPIVRSLGDLRPLEGFAPLNADTCKQMIYKILYEEQRAKFEQDWELDCSITVPNISRFRANIMIQKNGVEAVFRIISSQIPAPAQLGLTSQMVALADMPRGLVLVTGPTGAGKSTTLACLIEHINQKYPKHILTIEDPIEFIYENNKSIVRQREVGQQTRSFQEALRRALRQDPDVILVGEMRDLETISLALTAAETGHLCFATLHTADAPQTIDRIIDVFPPHQQQQVRVQLSNSLKGVVAQILLPKKNGQGRLAARELLLTTPAVANLIREGKTHMIYNAIETGTKLGMVSMDRSLAELVKGQQIALEEALSKAHNPQTLRSLIQGTGVGAVG